MIELLQHNDINTKRNRQLKKYVNSTKENEKRKTKENLMKKKLQRILITPNTG